MDANGSVPPRNHVQVSKRKKRSLDRLEATPKKRSTLEKTKATKPAASTKTVTNSATAGADFLKGFIPPRRHIETANTYPERLKSVPRKDELHPKLREMIGPRQELANRADSQPNQAAQSSGLSREAPDSGVSLT